MADRDAVDRIASEWRRERPDLDPSPMEVVGRLSRLSRLVDRRLAENYARFDIEAWMYDVLATLRRIGPPHELSAGDLVRQSMVTTGAITNRIDRLEQRGYVERIGAEDRRKVIVRLTPAGLAKVDEVAGPHLAREAELLAPLSERQQQQLITQLRSLLLHLGDRDDGDGDGDGSNR